MRVLFLDTETSDLPDRNPNAEIIAYTLRAWTDGVWGEPQTIHTFPCGEVAAEAAKVNGYSPEEWQRRGATRQFDWSDLANLQNLKDSIVGGHNTKFDLDMVAREFSRRNVACPKWNFRVVDTQPMAQALVALGVIQSASLVNVARYFGLDTGAAHSSEGDVNMTIQVWEKFLDIHLRAMGR